jgi:hypothetical protein
MALNVTGFSSASLDYKAFHDTAVVNTMVGNVTGTSGRLYHLQLDNSSSNTAVYYKVYFDADKATSDDPDLKIYVPASTQEILEIPAGVAFTQLSYFVTTTNATSNSQAASGTTVKLYGVTS